MNKHDLLFLVRIAVGVTILWYIGISFGFFPFMGDEIGYCTLIICLVIAVCTLYIIHHNDK